MKEIQSLLKIVSDGLKIIAQGVEAISEKVDEISKPQTVVKPKVKKAATAATKSKKAGKIAAKASKKKTAAMPTAAETVFQIISRSKKGADMATLMKKTGYDRKKVANVIYKLGKQGKIKSIDKGVYVKV
jgi:predicted Rossmann fold nucleotide-binding protein DprA/Smf involved in DNA uptake